MTHDRKQETEESRLNDVLAGDDELGYSRDPGNREGADEQPSAIPAPQDEYNRREVPGGTFRPATTPGGTGPSTRDTARSAPGDANEALVGREGLARAAHVKPLRQENDPDR